MNDAPVDKVVENTAFCPACASPNRCAVAAGQTPESCWCMQVVVNPASLVGVSSANACLCARCAAGLPALDTP